jgi:hypothetical protein
MPPMRGPAVFQGVPARSKGGNAAAMQPGPIALYSPKTATITRQPASMAIPPIVSARNRFCVMYPRTAAPVGVEHQFQFVNGANARAPFKVACRRKLSRPGCRSDDGPRDSLAISFPHPGELAPAKRLEGRGPEAAPGSGRRYAPARHEGLLTQQDERRVRGSIREFPTPAARPSAIPRTRSPPPRPARTR